MPRKPSRVRKRGRRPTAKVAVGDPRSQRRKAYARLFKRLELDGAWRRVPKRGREAVWDRSPVVWRVGLTGRARGHERAATVAALVDQVLDDPRLGYPCGEAVVTIRDMAELLAPLAAQIDQDRQAWQGAQWDELAADEQRRAAQVARADRRPPHGVPAEPEAGAGDYAGSGGGRRGGYPAAMPHRAPQRGT